MKKQVLLSAFMLIASLSFAQQANKFRLGIETGYTFPKGGSGILMVIEPKYNITRSINVGIRYQLASMSREIANAAGQLTRASLTTNHSLLGTLDYYIKVKNAAYIAPYAGIGAGVYSLTSVTASDYSSAAAEGRQFGGILRLGAEIAKYRFGLEYNFVPKSNYTLSTNNIAGSIKNSYFAITVGFFIGGGVWGRDTTK